MAIQIQQSDRRVGERIPSSQPVYFSDTAGWGSLCLGSLVDQSSGGVCIQTASPQAAGTRIDLEFLATSENGFVETQLSQGEIRYVGKDGPNGYLLGIKTLLPLKRTPSRIVVAFPGGPKLGTGTHGNALQPAKPSPRMVAKPKRAAAKSQKSSQYSTFLKASFLAVGVGIGVLLLLLGQQKSPVEYNNLTPGIAYSHGLGSVPDAATDVNHYFNESSAYQASPEPGITEPLEYVSAYRPEPQDSFLFASFVPDYAPSTRNKLDDSSSSDDAQSTNAEPGSAVEELARDLERAQDSVRSGDRMAALYLTRSAAESASDLPEPWRDVLREFRSTLISKPGRVPVLPKLDNWVTLSSPLANVPVDAPVVIYVDKDAFVMHVVKNGETVWQFPVGLGANGSTPEGIFAVGTKIQEPDWYNRGDVVPAGSLNNPLGASWMGLSDGDTPLTYGMHPTEQSESIGEALSRGCIRMRPLDAKRLYSMIPVGTPIVIRSGGLAPKL